MKSVFAAWFGGLLLAAASCVLAHQSDEEMLAPAFELSVNERVEAMDVWLRARSDLRLAAELADWQQLPLAARERLKYELARRARGPAWPALAEHLQRWQHERAQIRPMRGHHRPIVEEIAFPYPAAARGTLQIWQWQDQAEALAAQLRAGDCQLASQALQDDPLPLDWLAHAVGGQGIRCQSADVDQAQLAMMLAARGGSPGILALGSPGEQFASLSPLQARHLYQRLATDLSAAASWHLAAGLAAAHGELRSYADERARLAWERGHEAAGTYLMQRLDDGDSGVWFVLARSDQHEVHAHLLQRALGSADERQQRLLAAALVSTERPLAKQSLQRLADSPLTQYSVMSWVQEATQ